VNVDEKIGQQKSKSSAERKSDDAGSEIQIAHRVL
jgi:hypothetical protein